MVQSFEVFCGNVWFLMVEFALEWMEKLGKFIVVSLLTFMAVKFMLMTGEWTIWGVSLPGSHAPLPGILHDGVTKVTHLLFPSVGCFSVLLLLWAFRVSKFLPLVLLSFCLAGRKVSLLVFGSKRNPLLPTFPKVYFPWCLTPSPKLVFLSCEVSTHSFLFAFSPCLSQLNLYDPVWLPLYFPVNSSAL